MIRVQPRAGRRNWSAIAAAAGAGAVLIAAFAAPRGPAPPPDRPDPGSGPAEFRFPTVPDGHRHVRDLLANAMRYAAPETGITDPASGYPFEGWNNEPERGLSLRSFTQLTAVGLWLELLANVAAGLADTPHLSRDQALAQLSRVVTSLRRDQTDPGLGANGLLGNFLDLSAGRRRGLVAADVDLEQFRDAFGREKGEAIWRALEAEGWIAPRPDGDGAAVKRAGGGGPGDFGGALRPYRDEATARQIAALLGRRATQVVFGDNANLSASVAKAVGALLRPAVKDRPEAVALRHELEQFLDAQREGYAGLFDPEAGLFHFGWDGQRGRWIGKELQRGKWKADHLDYLVTEFRGPATFVVVRFGLPTAGLQNLGLQIRPYRFRDGRQAYALAPWEGCAFQALGLDVALGEVSRPSWRAILNTAVEVELDYAARHGLPGLLSESYTGRGAEYGSHVGIPEIAVSPKPRVTDAASLYSLGAAYTVAPDAVEGFLAANWPAVSGLLTDHGPWEGYGGAKREAIRIQTTAHTLALILGLLGTGSEHMARYLESRGLGGRLADMFRAGAAADLMAPDAKVFAWSRKGRPVRTVRDAGGIRVRGERAGGIGISFEPAGGTTANLSGGELRVTYRSAGPPPPPAVLTLKREGDALARGVLPQDVFVRFADTGEKEETVRVPLPATPGLTAVQEVEIVFGPGERAIDFTVTGLRFSPMGGDTGR